MGDFQFTIAFNRQETDLVITALKVMLGIQLEVGKDADVDQINALLNRFRKADR